MVGIRIYTERLGVGESSNSNHGLGASAGVRLPFPCLFLPASLPGLGSCVRVCPMVGIRRCTHRVGASPNSNHGLGAITGANDGRGNCGIPHDIVQYWKTFPLEYTEPWGLRIFRGRGFPALYYTTRLVRPLVGLECYGVSFRYRLSIVQMVGEPPGYMD